MTIADYFSNIKRLFNDGIATEHSYCSDLEGLIESIIPEIKVTNEPRRQECGAPDLIITRKEIPVGYVETKDIGISLDKSEKDDQLKKYLESLDNLILTDYLEFRLFRAGQKEMTARIAEIEGGKLKPCEKDWPVFEDMIRDFCDYRGQTITSAEKLARMMADKARLMRDIIYNALTLQKPDHSGDSSNTLYSQYQSFKRVLIHDMTEHQFADIYSQTVAYGLFAARIHDKTMETFSRQEALFLVPKSNLFLRNFFSYVAGPELDNSIDWIVDALADLFLACDLNKIMADFGDATARHDPVIHFYETFLAEYDPAQRKSRGVYYTPEPVVSFIVRAVDDILKSEFGLKMGLADTSKVEVEHENIAGGLFKIESHRVQILDPAAGTGTFLAEIIRRIYKSFESQKGVWNGYVDEHLLPRLHGFEILMASYAMCHLKMEFIFQETGYTFTDRSPRLGIYLTNSLEKPGATINTTFAQWLSFEAKEANKVKEDMPVMVVVGNPPYSVSSSNTGDWIRSQIKCYKEGLNEKKLNLDDDYIKFIRYAEHFIEKNGQGIVAMITNNSYIDGITHRQMRKHLMETFDKIYIYDLHGNSKKKETSPDGSKDENVFDIQQGVSINIFVKNGGKKKELSSVFHFDVFGEREVKYDKLWNSNILSLKWLKLDPVEPYCFFVPKDFRLDEEYNKGLNIESIFISNNTGIQTKRDNLVYSFSKEELLKIIIDLKQLSTEEIRYKYNLGEDGRDWSIKWAMDDIKNNNGVENNVLYHPFDDRYTYFTGKSKGFMAYPRSPLMNNMLKENICLLAIRNSRRGNVTNYFISNKIVDKDGVSPFDNCKIFPLYLYDDDGEFDFEAKSDDSNRRFSEHRRPNLNMEIVNAIAGKIGLEFKEEDDNDSIQKTKGAKKYFTPLDILDYIYAVLHSPSYREKYKEFLKIDFPRIPYPESAKIFFKLAEKGAVLRKLHLMESPLLENLITAYPETGNNEVEKVIFEKEQVKSKVKNYGKVWINKKQFFGGVPESAGSSTSAATSPRRSG